MNRFRSLGIKDTIVFFGSARIKSRREAKKWYQALKAKYGKKRSLSSGEKRNLEDAATALAMSRYYEEAVELSGMLTRWSKRLSQHNRFVVCSGGGPGIMEAANKGAYLAGGKSLGLNISLPFEQFANAYISRDLNFDFHYFFMRKFWFVYLAKALIMFPGGFGTLDELMEVLTLLQTNKIKKRITVVLYGSAYWRDTINFGRMVDFGVISQSDLQLFTYADSPEETFKYLTKELRRNYPVETEVR